MLFTETLKTEKSKDSWKHHTTSELLSVEVPVGVEANTHPIELFLKIKKLADKTDTHYTSFLLFWDISEAENQTKVSSTTEILLVEVPVCLEAIEKSVPFRF